jgi:hypothetical protein
LLAASKLTLYALAMARRNPEPDRRLQGAGFVLTTPQIRQLHLAGPVILE